MVINYIKKKVEEKRQEKIEEELSLKNAEVFRDNEDIRKAAQIKKEADRLSNLKQYRASIDEYHKALELFPEKREKSEFFPKVAQFLFDVHFSIASCFYHLNDLRKAIEHYDAALDYEIPQNERAAAYMGKGSAYYGMKKLVDAPQGESLTDIQKKEMDAMKKLDDRKSLLKLSHESFSKAVELDRNSTEAWYNKGHMEFLLGNVKDAMLSFDVVLTNSTHYENAAKIELFEELKKEKGIKDEPAHEDEEKKKKKLFKTKTGHYVRSKVEKLIADFLFEQGLLFQYHVSVAWSDSEDFRPLFFIPKFNLYVEHFYSSSVEDEEAKKIMFQYEKNRKNFIYTLEEDESNIEDALRSKMRPYFKNRE